jgi:hypothetical protein
MPTSDGALDPRLVVSIFSRSGNSMGIARLSWGRGERTVMTHIWGRDGGCVTDAASSRVLGKGQ